MNIKKLFLDLTAFTIPHGMEHQLEKFLPRGYEEDGCGNYYIKIGNSKTIFTCHMDTVCGSYEKVNHVINGNIITTNGHSVLSADDKCGMTIMLYMIYRKVPGTYYFFQGEESGCAGSNAIFSKNKEFFSDFDRMVSFDRRAYHSVITHQMGRRGCSEEFALALTGELNVHGFNYRPDNTGIYTDSATFMGFIPEATNLSVGYFNEHSHSERTDIKFLEDLAKASCLVHWENLPIGDKTKGNDKYGYGDEWDEYGGYGIWYF
jgi:putative aminopeptidase FrvX